MDGRVLVVEDDADMRQMLEDELGDAGFVVTAVASAGEALSSYEQDHFDAVLTDLIMPGMPGSELLTRLQTLDRHVPVIIMTAFGSVDSAVQAIKDGAIHYITKPFRIEDLTETLRQTVAQRQMQRRLADSLSRGAGGAPPIVAESRAMKRTLEMIARVAPTDSAVLILGQSGTGKELLARALHAGGPRRERPFLAVNCSAIPETLLESQLFGHRRGAFTDAREDRRGLFQEAEGGTVFLDEVGDMALALQAKLLRVLQEREVHPLGAPAPVPVDVRVVAATHQPLEELVAEGRFRRDLFYRLNVIAIEIPPLAGRPEDIPPLVAHFLDKHGRRTGRTGCTCEPEVMDALLGHSWPGNVRELENAIERAVVLGRGPTIRLADLPGSFRVRPGGTTHAGVRSLAEVEREQIIEALRAVRGNKAAAARLLGLDRKTLYRKLESYGIRIEPNVP